MRYLSLFIVFITFFGTTMPIMANQIQLDAALATPVMLADQKQTVYLRVGLAGLAFKQEKIIPINVALVIDKSGSMQGEKIHQAKNAAIMAVKRLRKDDIVAVVTYNHYAEVLLPATKVQEKASLIAAISNLTAGGQTALFDGVENGAKQVRKFLDRKRVNRIILVSDGLANVGPSSPSELALLGTNLGKEGIVVTTIGLGLGYNEDLMTQLAKKSDGNHAFAENATDLARFFDFELGDILAVVAQEVVVTIIGTEGVRPVQVLGRDAEIKGQQISVQLNQIYAEQEKYVLLELEIPAIKTSQERMIAGVAVVYRNMNTDMMERLSNVVTATFTDSTQLVEKETNALVMTAVVEQLAVEKNQLAVKLRDEGKIKEARQVLLDNASKLEEDAAKYDSKELEKLRDINRNDAENLDERQWNKQRKSMRREQHKSQSQQQY